jgi:hypothetical protein
MEQHIFVNVSNEPQHQNDQFDVMIHELFPFELLYRVLKDVQASYSQNITGIKLPLH